MVLLSCYNLLTIKQYDVVTVVAKYLHVIILLSPARSVSNRPRSYIERRIIGFLGNNIVWKVLNSGKIRKENIVFVNIKSGKTAL